MKGVIFTEFLEFVAGRYGEDMVDDIIAEAMLPSAGAYTTVGTYSHEEMVTLCATLSARTGEAPADLVRALGIHLSETFSHRHPDFFSRAGSFFDFLESVEEHIHVEVRKLYPDAELPSFKVEERTATRMVMLYRSPRRMAPMADGLITGSARRFGTVARVRTTPVDGGAATRFVIDLG